MHFVPSQQLLSVAGDYTIVLAALEAWLGRLGIWLLSCMLRHRHCIAVQDSFALLISAPPVLPLCTTDILSAGAGARHAALIHTRTRWLLLVYDCPSMCWYLPAPVDTIIMNENGTASRACFLMLNCLKAAVDEIQLICAR